MTELRIFNILWSRYVILGNHRDAWTFGASDPNSGTAAMIEVVVSYKMFSVYFSTLLRFVFVDLLRQNTDYSSLEQVLAMSLFNT